MKKYLRILILLFSLIATLALVSGQAAANQVKDNPERTYWEATQWLCIMDYDASHTSMWETNNTGHGRNGHQWSFGGRADQGFGPTQ